jgi:hypothetical protein
VLHVRELPLRQDLVELHLSTPDGEHMEHGELVQLNVDQDHKHEHVCVLLVTPVVLHVKELLLRPDHVVLQ